MEAFTGRAQALGAGKVEKSCSVLVRRQGQDAGSQRQSTEDTVGFPLKVVRFEEMAIG